MSAERNRIREALRRLGRVCLLLCGMATFGGCRFLADELTVLDRRAPTAVPVPDAPVSGLVGRP